MIVAEVIAVFITIIGFLLGSVNIPAIPQEIMAGLDFITNMILGSMQFLVYVFGAPLLIASLLIIPTCLFINFIWGFISFSIRIISLNRINLR